jgi:ABC-type branched-subunit amino acid transport system substrate-binding protein
MQRDQADGWGNCGGNALRSFRRNRRVRLAAVGFGSAVVLAACSGGGGGEPAPGGNTASGDPVKIMIIAPTDTPASNVPEAVASANAAVRALNDRGGVRGHPVELVHCNERNDPAAAKECAQQAVDDDVLAVVSIFNGSGGIMPVLEEAGIPAIGSTGIAADGSELSSDVSFMLSPLTFYPAVCPSILVDAGATHVGLVGYDLAVSDRLVTFAETGAKAVDLPLDPSVRVPITTSDFTPTVSQLTRAGVDGTVLVVFEQAAYAVIQGGGDQMQYCHATSTLSEDFLASQGAAADQLVVATAYPEFGQAADFPELQRMIDELAAEEAAGNAAAALAAQNANISINAWLSVQVVEQVGNAVAGDLTSATLLEQLNTTSALDLGLVPTLDFTTETPLPSVERVFNTTLRGARWDSATQTFVSLGPATYSALDILREGAAAG